MNSPLPVTSTLAVRTSHNRMNKINKEVTFSITAFLIPIQKCYYRLCIEIVHAVGYQNYSLLKYGGRHSLHVVKDRTMWLSFPRCQAGSDCALTLILALSPTRFPALYSLFKRGKNFRLGYQLQIALRNERGVTRDDKHCIQ